MRRIIALFGLLSILLCGCAPKTDPADIAATTLPVWEFTTRLCQGTGLTVTQLVTQSVSCLHDYSLNVNQVKAAEAADLIVISGAGLEEFMEEILERKSTVDASVGIQLLESCHEHEHEHAHEHEHEHSHEHDAHIWLSPENAAVMAENISDGLIGKYPDHQETFEKNLTFLLADIAELQSYGEEQLGNLSCTEIITFHDGFAYFADTYHLTILKAIEEESGSEASAAELKEIIGILREHSLPAIFTEENGSTSAAATISAETGAAIYSLSMAMSGDSWFEAMYHNIDTIKEALG